MMLAGVPMGKDGQASNVGTIGEPPRFTNTGVVLSQGLGFELAIASGKLTLWHLTRPPVLWRSGLGFSELITELAGRHAPSPPPDTVDHVDEKDARHSRWLVETKREPSAREFSERSGIVRIRGLHICGGLFAGEGLACGELLTRRAEICRQIHLTRDFFSNTLTLSTHHIVARGVAACV